MQLLMEVWRTVARAMVRVDERPYSMPPEVSKQERKPIGQVTTGLLARRRKGRSWQEMDEDFASLRVDSEA